MSKTKMKALNISSSILTQRTSNISRYLTDINKYPLLTPDEEFEIAKAAYAGDRSSIELLVKSNLRFVVSVAKQYSSNSSELLEELISYGNIGLQESAETFDPTRGFKFISYAVWNIRKEIMYYLMNDHKHIRIPQNILTIHRKMKTAEDHLFQKHGRFSTSDELQEYLVDDTNTINKSDFKRAILYDLHTSALDGPDPDAFYPINYLSNPNSNSKILDNDYSKILNAIFKSISKIDRDIVERRLGLHNDIAESFSMIGDSYNKTSEWARSKYTVTIRKIKASVLKSKMDPNILFEILNK